MGVMAKNDQHKNRGKLVRLQERMWNQLDILVDRNGSSATEEIRIAVREHLRAAGLWPPPTDDPKGKK